MTFCSNIVIQHEGYEVKDFNLPIFFKNNFQNFYSIYFKEPSQKPLVF